jgi:hypothetical protein
MKPPKRKKPGSKVSYYMDMWKSKSKPWGHKDLGCRRG